MTLPSKLQPILLMGSSSLCSAFRNFSNAHSQFTWANGWLPFWTVAGEMEASWVCFCEKTSGSVSVLDNTSLHRWRSNKSTSSTTERRSGYLSPMWSLTSSGSTAPTIQVLRTFDPQVLASPAMRPFFMRQTCMNTACHTSSLALVESYARPSTGTTQMLISHSSLWPLEWATAR